ncbi:MAG: beta galactosidase jelly roll domain-containing protein [Bacteroidetes bacterium]|nr:beta galactosidase jelly roll domain-containing protein [Bacteroidota bacterium]
MIDLAGDWTYSLDNGVTWNAVRIPAAADYTGKIVYRRTFSVTESSVSNNSYAFISYGMNYAADVYVNETFVGRHEGGYTSFEFAIPENVIQVGSENVIRVVVDNTLTYRTTFPPRPHISSWKNYNGILRDLFIEARPKLWIGNANVVVEAIEPKAVKLLVTATVSAKDLSALPQLTGKTLQLSADIAETANAVAIGKSVVQSVVPQSNGDVTVRLTLTLPNAKLWSPETPDLYTVTLSLIAAEGKKDSLIDRSVLSTGIRTFTREKGTLLLNGAPVALRGVVWIEDSERFGSAMTYEEMERDVALIKSLGANTVRIGFHPPHPFFLQLCDRYGLMAMVEVPNVEIPAAVVEEENYRTLVSAAVKEMIARDRYRPSVIAWGLGEGSAYAPSIENSILTQIHQLAKSLDDRLTYVVVRGPSDDAASVTDIAAIAVAPTDPKKFRARLQAFKEANPKRPVIVAAYGRPTELGNRNGYSDPHSQEAQARFIHQRYAAIKDMGFAGSFIFSFNDFRSDRPGLTMRPLQPTVHAYGVVESGRQKKVAYDLMHSVYHDQKVSALPVGTYVASVPYVYVIIGLVLLVTAAWMLNSNRRFRESAWRSIFKSYNFFADIRDQFTLPLFHTTLTAVIISVTVSVIFSSLLHHFRQDPLFDHILSQLLSDDVKMIIIRMCWDPLLSVGYLTGVMLVWFVLLTVMVQLFAMVARVKIRLFHSYSIAVWTTAPWGFFIPVGMILYRVLESDPYVPWVLLLVAFMSAWVYLRTLKGISVIYHVYTPKMYMIGLTVMLIAAGAVYAYADYAFAFTAYTEFYLTRLLPYVH